MTKYPLDLTKIEYYLWRHIFCAISHPQFSQMIEWIEFPFEPSPELRLLAHDFSFYDLKLYENTDELGILFRFLVENGETATLDLLDGVQLAQLDKNDQYYAKKDMLYKNTFEKLRELGYFDLIYVWAKKSYRNFDSWDVASIIQCSELIEHWAIANWLENNNARKGYTIEQETLMDDFTKNMKRPRITFHALPLPKEQEQKIQMFSLEHAYKTDLYYQKWKDVREFKRATVWEAYVVMRIPYLSYDGQWRRSKKMMQAIVDMLSTEDDLQTLYIWIASYQYFYKRIVLPFPKFIFDKTP